MTIDRMAQDGIELADYPRHRLNKSKIIVRCPFVRLGHRPEDGPLTTDLFYALRRDGPGGRRDKEHYSAAYDALGNKARAIGNQSALAELTRVGPPPYKSGDGYAC